MDISHHEISSNYVEKYSCCFIIEKSHECNDEKRDFNKKPYIHYGFFSLECSKVFSESIPSVFFELDYIEPETIPIYHRYC